MTSAKQLVEDEQKKNKELWGKLKISQSHIDFRNKIDDFVRRIKEKFHSNGEKTKVSLGIFRSLQLLIEEKDLFAAYHIFSRSIAGLLREQAEREIGYKFHRFRGMDDYVYDYSRSRGFFETYPIFISQDFTDHNFQYFEPVYIDKVIPFTTRMSLVGMECEEDALHFFLSNNVLPNQYVVFVCVDPFWLTHSRTLEGIRERLEDERFMYVDEIPQFYVKFKEKLRSDCQYVFAGVLSPTSRFPVLIIEDGKPKVVNGIVPELETIFPVAGKTQMK